MNILSIKYLAFVLCSYFLYWLTPVRQRRYVLLCSSLLFLLTYGLSETILVLIYSVLAYYLSGICRDKKRLTVSLIILLLPLLFSKYAPIVMEKIGSDGAAFPFSR